ncbi:MAG: DUF5671 domain-containing protein [Rhodanobacter sp.]|jgi:hypothetical protein|nr:DUF5671 domain-containing protein [Rhodanobacter sp.]
MASGIQNLELFVRSALANGLQRSDIEHGLLQAGWPAEQIKSAMKTPARHEKIPFIGGAHIMASGIQELERFVYSALAKGLQKPDIEQGLLQAGWPAEQIKSALGLFADIAFPVPIPKPRPYLSAREAFYYLLLFTTLYLSANYLGSLLFDLVNLKFLDPTEEGYPRESLIGSIRWAASFLIVAFPVFLFLSYRIQRELTQNAVKRLSTIRRWLTYLTLFAAAGFLIGDLVTLVYSVLGGELTIRFILKVLIVGVIAGTIFGFYLWDLRAEEREV